VHGRRDDWKGVLSVHCGLRLERLKFFTTRVSWVLVAILIRACFMGRFHIDTACTLALATLVSVAIVCAQSVPATPTEKQTEAAASTLHGVVRDANNRPIAGATVCLQAQDTRIQMLTAHTDSAGVYAFPAVRPGIYTLRAEIAGHGNALSSDLNIGRKEARTVDLTLDAAKPNATDNSSPALPEFFDEPHFTVAGVADTSSFGGHGGDTIARNREVLAKATASLSQPSPDSDKVNSSRPAMENSLRDARAQLAVEGKSREESSELHHLLAETDEKLGHSLDAAQEYHLAAELNPSEKNLFDWGVELLLHRADEPAIEVFTKGNLAFPHSVRMLAGLGAAWYSNGSYEKAVQRFCEASDLNPEDPNPYLFMGKMQALESIPSPTIEEHLARFVTLQPQNPWANYYYAVSLQKHRNSSGNAEDSDRVKSFFLRAIRLDPKLAVAYLELGIVYSQQKDFPKAISALQHAIEADPKSDNAHYRLAQVYRLAGETSKAQTELQLYEQISKQNTEEIGRQRHELQQFVYELRDRTPASQPQ
jgi:tetratricopeptide (TPR) repeat protein